MTSSDQHKIDVNSEIVEIQPLFEQTHSNNNYDSEKTPHNENYHKLIQLKTDYYKNKISWHNAMPQVN